MHRAAILSILALAAAAYVVQRLYAVHTAWSVTFAILVAGGALVASAIALRNAPGSPARRARGSMPEDRGIPKPPQGAPYRGPL
jgi:hypothetical protein